VIVMSINAGLVGWWKLAGDSKDHSGLGNHGANHGVDLGAAAAFDGRSSYILNLTDFLEGIADGSE